MGLNTLNTDAISFKKLSGKVHTQQNFAVTEEGITTNVQTSYSTIFGNPIVSLPVTNSGLTSLYSTNGIVQRVKFQIDIIPDTQINVGRSQGYRLKLPADFNTFGALYPKFSAGTYLHTALGKLQIVPALYGTLKPDGTTEYDPILYQTNGTSVIAKFDPINWYLDPYSGILFIQDPPSGYDSSAARPGFIEAFLYVGQYLDNVIVTTGSSSSTGTTASNVGGGIGVFKQKTGQNLEFKSILGTNGIAVSALTNTILISYTGSSTTPNKYSLKRIITGTTTLTNNDFVLWCNGIGAINIDTPLVPVDGQVYKIKDVSGNALTNVITINGNGKTIDGSTTIQINSNGGGVEIVFDAILNGWFVMNFVS